MTSYNLVSAVIQVDEVVSLQLYISTLALCSLFMSSERDNRSGFKYKKRLQLYMATC